MQRQLKKTYLFAFSLLLGLALSTPATAQTYTTIDYPGAVKTIATGINSFGTIVGDFCSICKDKDKNVHGYILNQGAFTQIDPPGSVFTRALGINNAGAIVGYYRRTANGTDHGYLLSGGTFTAIDFPGASQTHAIGIDSVGGIFGSYCSGGNSCYSIAKSVHGFQLSGGVFTTIDAPGATYTELWGHDSAGQLAGRYQDASGIFHAFLLSNGSLTSIDFPGAAETSPGGVTFVGGINAGGDIASTYCTTEPCSNPSLSFHSFLLSGGTYTKIDVPGAAITLAAGVNSSDDVVGGYFDSSGEPHGFLRVP
jgi:uncharacterized membrane protein